MVLNEEQQADVLALLKRGEWAAGEHGACIDCDGFDFHTRACRVAHWLRALGGEAERQRQVDDAHRAALPRAPSPWAAKFPTTNAVESLLFSGIGQSFDSDVIFGKKP